MLRQHKFGSVPLVKQLPLQHVEGIAAMAFDPSGAWLLCVSYEAKLSIVPVLGIFVSTCMFVNASYFIDNVQDRMMTAIY